MSAAHFPTLAPDRTRLAVGRWLTALPAASFDLRLAPADAPGPTLCRRFDAAGLLAALGWIRARNAAGFHVYCRPLATRHVLVDDLSPDAVAELTAAHCVAAIVETSKANHQAWITLSAEEIPAPLAAAAARLLARRFGGDRGAASALQLGRLVGSTNRKEQHVRGDGSFPYVLLCQARPGVDPAGAALLAEAARHLRAPDPALPIVPAGHDPWAMREAAAARRWLTAALPDGARIDRSRADYATARRVLARGGDVAAAARVVLAGERARGMPADAARDYAMRTARAAAPSVAASADHGRPPGGPGKEEDRRASSSCPALSLAHPVPWAIR